MARFGQALNPQNLRSSFRRPQNLTTFRSSFHRPHLLCHGTSLGPTSCFYWASKLPCGTFSAGLKPFKTSAAAFEGLRTSQPSAFGHGASLGPTSCFYWAPKLPRGTFSAGLKTFKTSASEPHNPPQLQQLSAMVPPPRPHKLFLLGFESGTFSAGLKTFKGLRSSFRRPENIKTLRSEQLSAMVPP